MITKLLWLPLAVSIAAISALNVEKASAELVTFEFKGSVTSAFFDPSIPLDDAVDFGTPIVGTYTFDDDTPDSAPAPSVGSYSHFGAPFGMTARIGTAILTTSEFLNIGVADNIGAGTNVDQYTVLAERGSSGGLGPFLSMEVFLEDPSGTALTSDSLPILSSVLSNGFPLGSFFLEGVTPTGDGTFAQFQIQGTATVVSGPSTWPLLGLALLLPLVVGGLHFPRCGACTPV